MKRKFLLIVCSLFLCEMLTAQSYHYQYAHDTLGNRISRVYQGSRSTGGDASTPLGMTGVDSLGMTKNDGTFVISTERSEWRDLNKDISSHRTSTVLPETPAEQKGSAFPAITSGRGGHTDTYRGGISAWEPEISPTSGAGVFRTPSSATSSACDCRNAYIG